MQISVKVSQSTINEFQRYLLTELAKHIQRMFEAAKVPIQNRLRQECVDKLKSSPGYLDAINSELRAHLGLRSPETRLQTLMEEIAGTLEVAVGMSVVGNRLTGGIAIQLLSPERVAEFMSSPNASFRSEHGYVIEWVKMWLDTDPSHYPQDVEDYTLVLGRGLGRSGMGKMYEKNKRMKNGHLLRRPAWSMPEEYSGSLNDNWVTRALSDFHRVIDTVVEQEISLRNK